MGKVLSSMRGEKDTGESYEAGRDLDHTNTVVQEGIIEFLGVLKNLGFCGWRYDFVKEHNGLILHSAKRCKNSHFGTFYHWEDMANYRGTISFCPNCMKVELIQAYNDSVNSYR